MLYFTNQYAKLWSIDTTGRFPKARIGTSEKDREGKFVNSNWFATFLGDAKDKAEELEGNEKIKILKGKVSNIGKKVGNEWKNYLNVAIFDFEVTGGGSSRSDENLDQDTLTSDDEMPF
jgi:hypothetical protein